MNSEGKQLRRRVRGRGDLPPKRRTSGFTVAVWGDSDPDLLKVRLCRFLTGDYGQVVEGCTVKGGAQVDSLEDLLEEMARVDLALWVYDPALVFVATQGNFPGDQPIEQWERNAIAFRIEAVTAK